MLYIFYGKGGYSRSSISINTKLVKRVISHFLNEHILHMCSLMPLVTICNVRSQKNKNIYLFILNQMYVSKPLTGGVEEMWSFLKQLSIQPRNRTTLPSLQRLWEMWGRSMKIISVDELVSHTQLKNREWHGKFEATLRNSQKWVLSFVRCPKSHVVPCWTCSDQSEGEG